MKVLLTSVFAAMVLIAGTSLADDIKPIELSATQLDQITAGNLILPNGKTVFDGLDNAAPGEFHPSFDQPFGRRSTTANGTDGATTNNGPPNGEFGNEGPWSAHIMSDRIGCIDIFC